MAGLDIAEWGIAERDMVEKQKSLHGLYDYMVWTLRPLPRKGLRF